jgi:hypothetical protein
MHIRMQNLHYCLCRLLPGSSWCPLMLCHHTYFTCLIVALFEVIRGQLDTFKHAFLDKGVQILIVCVAQSLMPQLRSFCIRRVCCLSICTYPFWCCMRGRHSCCMSTVFCIFVVVNIELWFVQVTLMP